MLLAVILDAFYPSMRAELLLVFIGAGLGIGGAYWIYLKSIWQIRTDRLTYVSSLIQSMIQSARRQSEFCSSHREKILENPFANHRMQKLADRDTKRLADKVDQEGVYHAYLWKYKRNEESYKSFKDLYGIIDFLDFLLDDLLLVNEKILHNTWERKKQYQLTFTRAKESMQAMFLTNDLEQEQPELLALFKKQLDLFSETHANGENLVPSFEIVVQPVRQYIISKAKRHDKITELMFLLDDLDFQYSGIQLSASHNAEDYQYYAQNLSQKADQLEKVSFRLRNDFKN